MDIEEDNDGDDDNTNVDIIPAASLFLPLSVGQEDDENEVNSHPLSSAASPQLQSHYFRSIDSTVLIRQLPSHGLSFQLWPAATTLVNLFESYRSCPTSGPFSATLSALSNSKPHRILELGSGTGLVGIAAAALLRAEVTVTDLPHVLPNLRFNVDANSGILAACGGTVYVAPLRWGENEDMEAIGKAYDLILGSDVVYHDYLYDSLLKTLRLFLLGSEKEVVFVMGHLKRWKKESAFFKKAKKSFNVEVIHADRPTNGSRVGVVVYRFTDKGFRDLNSGFG